VPDTPPLISVIIPLYNKRTTIARTIESILAQTLGDFEVIVVDDGSSDGSPEFVAQAFPDPRIHIHRQPNAGPGAARNAGLSLARGELVTFLDADDAWRPELLARASHTLAAHPACVAFTSAFYNEPMGVNRWDELVGEGFREGVWRLTPQTPRDELRHCADAFHPTTAVYRRAAAVAAGGFYAKDRCTLGEDVYLWISLLLQAPIYRCMEPLAHYHTEDSQLGIGARKSNLPLEPVLTDPEPLRASCPVDLRPTLELWLGYQAVRAAFMQLERGNPANAPRLLKAFPGARAFGRDYWKLRLRLAAPWIWALRDRRRARRH